MVDLMVWEFYHDEEENLCPLVDQSGPTGRQFATPYLLCCPYPFTNDGSAKLKGTHL